MPKVGAHSGVALIDAPSAKAAAVDPRGVSADFEAWARELQTPGASVETSREQKTGRKDERDAKSGFVQGARVTPAKAGKGFGRVAREAAEGSKGLRPPAKIGGGILGTAAVAATPAVTDHLRQGKAAAVIEASDTLGQKLITELNNHSAKTKGFGEKMAESVRKAIVTDPNMEFVTDRALKERYQKGGEWVSRKATTYEHLATTSNVESALTMVGQKARGTMKNWDQVRAELVDTSDGIFMNLAAADLDAVGKKAAEEAGVRSTSRAFSNQLVDEYSGKMKGEIGALDSAHQKLVPFKRLDLWVKGGIGALNTGLAIRTLRTDVSKPRKALACLAAAVGWVPLTLNFVPQLAKFEKTYSPYVMAGAGLASLGLNHLAAAGRPMHSPDAKSR